MITSEKKSWELASANTLETTVVHSTSTFSSELQLINMGYTSPQENKVAHGVDYKMFELQDSC